MSWKKEKKRRHTPAKQLHVPAVTVTDRGILYFNREAVELANLKDVNFVEVWVNEEECILGIKPTQLVQGYKLYTSGLKKYKHNNSNRLIRISSILKANKVKPGTYNFEKYLQDFIPPYGFTYETKE